MPPGQSAPHERLSVPSVYDTSHGWESDMVGTHLFLPHSAAVAVFQQAANHGDFTVMDAATGATRWTRKVEGVGMMSALVTTEKGQDYLVATSSGTTGEDAVKKGRDVTTLDIFNAKDATSGAFTLAHHLELPGEGTVTDGGGGLLVRFGDETVATVDPATGATKTFDLRKMKPPAGECHLCFASTKALAVTSRGPLLATDEQPKAHYWVPGVWSGGTLTTDSENKLFMTPVGTALFALWHDDGATRDTLAVLDPATGKVRAKVDCKAEGFQRNEDAAKSASLSANGRYLVQENAAFDLEKGTGRCFGDTAQTKAVDFDGVTDDGTAFGSTLPVDGSEERSSVVVDIATGTVKADRYEVTPFGDFAGYGLFLDNADDADTDLDHSKVVAYRHAR
ncbi:hypothetical protein KBP30_39680 [Streptomyces sp. Go40/10]|uniref:hypothetical protein n=1 Tax=Streptomyces sp. Go40/10 TaxID=2825844 RepID=UPI001E3FDD55|nr:hypothetical protein [Streptomyces sp. Go40/10]UFR06920.1 hypothetical protein KBP30_39680 [Streptomyces sp. Go40/10]